jgi:hypothetical protein
VLHFFRKVFFTDEAMARIKYYYDTDSSQFKRVYDSIWSKILGVMNVIFLSSGLAILMVISYHAYFESPPEVMLKEEIKQLEINYTKLDQQLNSLHDVMSTIEKRDDHVYRMVLGAEPIDEAVRKGGVGGAQRYMDIRDKRLDHTDMIIQLYQKVDKLRRNLYIESISQDELMKLAEDKKSLYASIPAIQPISNKQLTALTSGFGLRVDPFYRVMIMHTGIDFAAPEGTPVYATADGRVMAADTTVYGYGKMVTIDHGYGYQTRYAHLSQFHVKPGMMVKRGQRVALVGNTGLSTASHLHYEVMLQGTQINPIHYFFSDLNPREYEKITQLASVQNQTMGK